MHHLHAQPLFDRYELNVREAGLFLLFRFRDSPVEILPRHEIRNADNGYPVEILLVFIIDTLHTGLPPEALQRRHDIIKISFDLVRAFFAHLQRERDAVELPDGRLVRAALLVRVANAAHGDVIHRRYLDDLRLCLGHIVFFIFLFVIKRHISLLHFVPIVSYMLFPGQAAVFFSAP